MMISELPEDLLEEIFYRVPATSLKRLLSTCKGWNRLFKDRRFTRKHLDKAPKQFLILMPKKFRLCSMSINLQRIQPVELIGELTLIHPRSSLGPIKICVVSHCDGLLLCVIISKDKEYSSRLVVWNPCTGQTKLIINHHKQYTTYALGSYKDKKSNDISYKILSHNGCYGHNQEFRIYEVNSNSNSWRILDVTIGFSFFVYTILTSPNFTRHWGVYLKGKTYWIARDHKKEGHLDKFLLVSFDYTTERFERLCLPSQYRSIHDNPALSVVREEKLSVLFQRDYSRKTEIWVTNKIGETKVVSWSRFLKVDLGPEHCTWYGVSVWIDEEKKVLVYSYNIYNDEYKKIHIMGEDKKVRTEDLEIGSSALPWLNYVPSLVQIEGRRKRGK